MTRESSENLQLYTSHGLLKRALQCQNPTKTEILHQEKNILITKENCWKFFPEV